MTLSVRLLKIEDVKAYREVRLEALWDTPRSFGEALVPNVERALDFFENELSERPFFGSFIDDRLVGTVSFKPESSANMAHRGILQSIYVRPDFRSRGCGIALIEFALDFAQNSVMQVHSVIGADNLPAMSLFKRAGFTQYGTTPRALLVGGDYIDEHQMVKFLKQEEDL